MVRRKTIIVLILMAAAYCAVGTIEYRTEVAAQKAGVYAPDPMRMGEDPDVLAW
jgi:hypothetical protein